jgi:GrpB-like predicted nucleotidyltransferase (UPF0157 family)/ribosomal protein S18 acetylase RimI-like enzyme
MNKPITLEYQDIKIETYNPTWPEIFEKEAALIKEVLGDNCIAIHHIGSTAVTELSAKPVIDIIPVVSDITLVDKANSQLAKLGYEAKGEHGMLFRRYFQKVNPDDAFNVHIYEQSNSEIDRCIKFRDWMRNNPDDREAYSELKKQLAAKFPNDIFGYCFGKDEFVAQIDKKTGFDGLRVVKALTPTEWEFAKQVRQKYFFDKNESADLYTHTFDLPDHVHLVLYKGSRVVGYTHIQLWPDSRAAIRILVIENFVRNQSFGKSFLKSCERWLKSQGYDTLHVESSPAALNFYHKNGYTKMPFNDSEKYEGFAQDISLGKKL